MQPTPGQIQRRLRGDREWWPRVSSDVLDRIAALTGRFASCQHRSLARPVRTAPVLSVLMA